MRQALTRFTVPTLVGVALGASVLALSTKALAIAVAVAAFAAMAASSVFPYYILVATIPV